MRRIPANAAAVLCVLAGLTGCESDSTPEPSPRPGPSEGAEVTYWQDVAPIFRDNCLGCHGEGGIGPFRLDDPLAAKQWAVASKIAVETRTMPPYLVDNTGSCNTFDQARWLTQEEIDTVAAWADQGAAEGQPDPSVFASQPETPDLSGTVIEVKTPLDYDPVPSEDYPDDHYRCFLVDPGLEAETYIKGYDVVPGNAELVHHVLAFIVDPAEVVGQVEDKTLTNMDMINFLKKPDRQGWPCFAAAGSGVNPRSLPVTWAPGMQPVEYPHGVGLKMHPGEVLVVQMHYSLLNGLGLDQTTIRLEVSDETEREGVVILHDPFLGSSLDGAPVPLAAGEPRVQFTWDNSWAELMRWEDRPFGPDQPYAELVAIVPHMHKLGVRMDVWHSGGEAGEDQCVAEVPRWDFDWQRMYFLSEPLRLTEDMRLHATCTWDTTSKETITWPGFGTTQEMCLLGAVVALPPK